MFSILKHGDRPLKCIVGRIGKQCHNRIADVFIDEPTIFLNLGFHVTEILVNKSEVFLWSQTFRDGCKVADIGEENCHFSFDAIAQFHIDNTLFL